MIDPDDFSFNCSECGEFDCELDHTENNEDEDDSWFFDGSGMVGDI